MAKRILFHKDIENPKDLVLISSVFIDKEIRKLFEDNYNVHNIFVSNSKPYLYGFSLEDELIRCDIIFE